MTLDLTDAETGALVHLLRRTSAYRNSGQPTIPAAKIIANVQKSFFFIGGSRSYQAAAGISETSASSSRMSSKTRNASRPRDKRERTVPSGMPRVAAASS